MGAQTMLIVTVKEENYVYDNMICIMFEELFHLYNQDAVEKSFISCYCV
jgi:hypothetical protein